MNKTKIYWLLLNSIFLILFNLFFFLLKGPVLQTSAWISYGSIHFAYFMLLATPYFVKKGSASADYGRPLFMTTISYFLLALVVGVVLILVSPQSYTASLLVQATLAAVFGAVLIANLIANEHTAGNFKRKEIELFYVKEASSKLNYLMNKLPDKNYRKFVERAYDLIHSSQVRSSPEVSFIEQSVFNEISRLEELIRDKNLDGIESVSEKICDLAEERNRKLRLIN